MNATVTRALAPPPRGHASQEAPAALKLPPRQALLPLHHCLQPRPQQVALHRPNSVNAEGDSDFPLFRTFHCLRMLCRQGYSGPTTCVAPYTCKYSNDWYSQVSTRNILDLWISRLTTLFLVPVTVRKHWKSIPCIMFYKFLCRFQNFQHMLSCFQYVKRTVKSTMRFLDPICILSGIHSGVP